MKSFIVSSLIVIYIILSAFLETEGGSRITPADIFLVALIGLAMIDALGRRKLFVSRVQLAALPLLAVFLMGAIFSRHVDRAAFELIVILFSFIGSIAIANLLIELPNTWLRRFAAWYVLAMGGLAAVCLVDFLILPGLVSSRNLGGVQGPFRNTGQAGSFFGVHFVLVFALVVSRIVPRNVLFSGAVLMTFLALVLTLKRSSNIAVFVGIFLFIVMMFMSKSVTDKKIGLRFAGFAIVSGVIGTIVFQFALGTVSRMKWRLERKYSSDTIEKFSEGFLVENIEATLNAFSDSPIFGVGLGNVYQVYMSHEIHSTYLGVIAYSGLLGVIAYIFFMFRFFYEIYREKASKFNNEWAYFLYVLMPMVLGQMIGWGYTVHIRKREFWILLIFVVVAARMSRRSREDGRANRVGPKIFSRPVASME